MQAVTVAAALAQRTQQTLELVNCLEVPAHESYDAAKLSAAFKLSAEATRLKAQGVDIREQVLVADDAAAALLARAHELVSCWIVVGSHGQSRKRSGVGSKADALAAQSHVPVLVVRDAAPFVAWMAEEAPLRLLLGADLSSATKSALAFTAALQAIQPCTLNALHLFWPPEQFARLGYGGFRSFLEVDPEIRKEIGEGLTEVLGDLPIQAAPTIGNFGDTLARDADAAKVGLIVVGAHARTAVKRVWDGSVSRGVLQNARTNVACVPVPEDMIQHAPKPLRHVLVATDFSETGNAAVPLAYSAVAEGGTVFMIHVIGEQRTSSFDPTDILALEHSETPSTVRDDIHHRLRALIPAIGAGVPCNTVVHVVQSNHPAQAIAQAAERLHADVICVGTHGRSGLAKTVLGSVAHGVLEHTKRPVLLARIGA
jgi:nucleotide-binding universal stress UspA family protein